MNDRSNGRRPQQKARSAAEQRTRSRLIEQALSTSYKRDNIHYLDWNQVDWFLVSKGWDKITTHTSTADCKYGIVTFYGDEYEYLLFSGSWGVSPIKQIRS